MNREDDFNDDQEVQEDDEKEELEDWPKVGEITDEQFSGEIKED